MEERNTLSGIGNLYLYPMRQGTSVSLMTYNPGDKIRLRVLYEDPDVVVVTAPNEDELKQILLGLLHERPMNLKELHSVLSGLASEDKIRKALSQLMEQNRVIMEHDGKYKTIGI